MLCIFEFKALIVLISVLHIAGCQIARLVDFCGTPWVCGQRHFPAMVESVRITSRCCQDVVTAGALVLYHDSQLAQHSDGYPKGFTYARRWVIIFEWLSPLFTGCQRGMISERM
jgi:hypothetical protein